MMIYMARLVLPVNFLTQLGGNVWVGNCESGSVTPRTAISEGGFWEKTAGTKPGDGDR